MVYHGK